MKDSIIEVVQTGNVHTAFILEPESLVPKRIVSSVCADALKTVATLIYPQARVVEPQVFVTEVDTRVQQTFR